MSEREILRHHLLRSLHRDLDVPMSTLQLDQHGNLCIPYLGQPIWAKLLVEQSITWVRVWTVAAEALRPTARLLREINQINLALRACRAQLSDTGQLIIAAEVICESVEPGELGHLTHVVRGHAQQVGELVRLVHAVPELPSPPQPRP